VATQLLPRLRIYLLPKPKPDGRSSDFRINLLPAPSRSVWYRTSGNLRVSSPNTAAGPYRNHTGFPIIPKTALGHHQILDLIFQIQLNYPKSFVKIFSELISPILILSRVKILQNYLKKYEKSIGEIFLKTVEFS
jgi:hypothetical protein